MITIISIVVVLILVGFIYVQILKWIDHRKYYSKYREIFEAHQKLGYPELTKEEQFAILDNEDDTPLKRITDYDFVPGGLYDHYINIEPDEYYEHLKKQDVLSKMNLDSVKDKLSDGFYIEKRGRDIWYIFNDRRQRVFEKKFNTDEQLLRYLVFEKLRLYAPKYKKTMKRKYYA
jgi:hypothetical protein